jgi:hypothetical protein
MDFVVIGMDPHKRSVTLEARDARQVTSTDRTGLTVRCGSPLVMRRVVAHPCLTGRRRVAAHRVLAHPGTRTLPRVPTRRFSEMSGEGKPHIRGGRLREV